MHSVNFSFNLKLSIQKHKYSLPHFPSNQTNTKADTDRERERERERERLKHKSDQTGKSRMKQRLSKFFIEIVKYIEQDAILVFRNHFLEKQTDRKERERVVTWWTREERSDWTSRRWSSDPSSSSSTPLYRSSSFSENLRSFFISKGFENVPPLLYFLLDTSLNGFLSVFDFDFASVFNISLSLSVRNVGALLSLCVWIYRERRAFILCGFFIILERSSESRLGVALARVCLSKIGWARQNILIFFFFGRTFFNLVDKFLYRNK